MVWKLLGLVLGVLTLRRLIVGVPPAPTVYLASGRAARVLRAQCDAFSRQPNDPGHVYGDEFQVAFVADGLSPADRAAVMPELAAWAATLPAAQDCERIMVWAGVHVVEGHLWRRWRGAEWAEFRRIPGGVEPLRDGAFAPPTA